jgi:hypothetical protein
VTGPGDDSWLSAYRYDVGGDRWVLRDGAAEEPFVDAVQATLDDWQVVLNEMQEVVGLRLWFDGQEVPLIVREGEIST